MPQRKKPPEFKRSSFTGFNMTPRERDELGRLCDLLAARNPEIEISTAAVIRTAINAVFRAMTDDASGPCKGRVRAMQP